MSIDTNRLVRHMNWANQRVYSAVQELPDAALGSYLVNAEWTAAQILEHIVAGAEWYVYCLTGRPLVRFDQPESMADVARLALVLLERDAIVAQEALKDDEVLAIDMGDGVYEHYRSTLIAQAIHHATEHRAQLIDALEFRGYKPINLDDIDLWGFADFEKAHS